MRPLIYFLLLSLTACSKNEELAYKDCSHNLNGARLSKKVTTVFHPTYNEEKTEDFFYDKNGRLDSVYITRKNLKTSLIWDSSIRYFYNDMNLLIGEKHFDIKYNSFNFYTYEYDETGKLIKQYTESPLQDKTILKMIIKNDELGRIKSYRYNRGDDLHVITYDGCGNPIKEQAFYDKDGREHYLSVAEFSAVLNPLYYKNMPSFSYSSNPYLLANAEIVHWDCADYIGGKLLTEYETNSLNLPLKSKQYYKGGDVISVSEYFY